jgi:hypothetical protein
VELLSDGIPTVHFQSQLRNQKMQINSTPTLKKCELFSTGNQDLDALMAIWHNQAMVLADAEQAGLPEPEISCPPLPRCIKWNH